MELTFNGVTEVLRIIAVTGCRLYVAKTGSRYAFDFKLKGTKFQKTFPTYGEKFICVNTFAQYP